MNKTICDLCKKNEANQKYRNRVEKRKMFLYSVLYDYVDICDECFEKLFKKGEWKNDD